MWIVEIIQVDICIGVSMMSSHLLFPCDDYTNGLYCVLAYPKKHHNFDIIFDPSDPVIDEVIFDRCDWSTLEFGFTTKEQMPGNMPEAQDF